MRFWKKLACLVLALALIVALCSCGAFAPRMVTGVQKMAKLNSFHSDSTITADVTLRLLEQDTPLTLTVHVLGDHQKDPGLNALDLTLSLMDFDQHLLVYTVKEGETLSVYSSWNNGEVWTRSTVEAQAEDAAASASELSPADLLKLGLGLASYFSETGPVELTGEDGGTAEGIGYEGLIPADMLREILRSSGLIEKLNEKLPAPLDDSALALIGDLPVQMVLDKDSSMICRVEMDLGTALGELLNRTLASLLEENEFLGAAVELRIDGFRTVTELSRFDSVTVVLPSLPES